MPQIRLGGILTPPVSTQAEKPAGTRNRPAGESFSGILDREISGSEGVHFSKHAQSRLELRNIVLDSGELSRLNQAVEKAAGKGVRDSLVVMDNLAFIVSVPDKTVVTAMPVGETEENVFTNIDGAVIL